MGLRVVRNKSYPGEFSGVFIDVRMRRHDLVFPTHEISLKGHINDQQSGTLAYWLPSGLFEYAIAFIRRSAAIRARSHKRAPARRFTPDLVRWVDLPK